MWLNALLRATVTALSALACQAALADALDGERLTVIDAHALAAPSTAEASTSSLVRYLSQPTRNDTEKARAIFRWVADRISYDTNAYFSNNLVNMSADEVLRQRRSICDGYSSLFEQLAREAGMEVVTIKGYAKAYGHTPGERFERPNHAWNAIKIDGQWRLVDTTWGAGYVRNGHYVKVLTETFFLAPPEQFIFSHLPLDEAWQLQSTPHLSKAQFEALPDLEPAFFHLGFDGADVWRAMTAPGFSGNLVRTYDVPFHVATVQRAPLSYRLMQHQALQFAIRSKAFDQMAIVQGDNWTVMTSSDGVFTADIAPQQSGDLMVVGKTAGTGNYTAILGYVVGR